MRGQVRIEMRKGENGKQEENMGDNRERRGRGGHRRGKNMI